MVEQAIRLLAAVPETVPRAVLISTQPWTTPFRALETGTRRWRLPLRQAAVCSSTTRGCCVWRWVRQPAPSPVSRRAPALHRAVALPQSGRAALLGEASVLSSGLAFARNRYRRSPNLRPAIRSHTATWSASIPRTGFLSPSARESDCPPPPQSREAFRWWGANLFRGASFAQRCASSWVSMP